MKEKKSENKNLMKKSKKYCNIDRFNLTNIFAYR